MTLIMNLQNLQKDYQNNGQYRKGNENDSTIKFETKVIKPNHCDYSDVYILVTRDMTTTNSFEFVAVQKR